MIWSHTVVLPLAVPPATPIKKGSVLCILLAPRWLEPGEPPDGENGALRLSILSASVRPAREGISPDPPFSIGNDMAGR